MSNVRLLIAGLVHHRRMHLAVALGVAAATAVLAGALIVGDSMRGSLLHLAVDRLQRIEEVLVLPRFFRTRLADELSATPEFRAAFQVAVPLALLEGTVEEPNTHRRATHANILGIDDRFAELAASASAQFAPPARGEVCLNQALAVALDVGVGDECVVRLPIAREVPTDSALGRKTETVTSLRAKVVRVVPDEGLGRFALRPNQSTPRNVYVNLADVQQLLKQPDKVNAILVGGASADLSSTPAKLQAAHESLQSLLRPALADYGISIEKTKEGYYLLESDRMILEPAVVAAAEKAWGAAGAQLAFTYLANTVADGDRSIPYSTITAIDFAENPPLGGFQTPDGLPIAALADDECALNAWAAEELAAKPGDRISITYFEPESTHGNVRERTVELKLKAIVALQGAAADARLTPTLPGVTDQLSIADWNPPFPFDSQRIRPRDEEYWDNYKATPKGFVSLRTGQKLWGSRFGETTSVRIPPRDGTTAESLADDLQLTPTSLGFEFQPIRLRAVEASIGATPFEYLFIGFSFFIIAAALMLVAILFRLGVDGRASEVGLLLAMGWPLRRVRWLLLAETAIVALLGATVGAAIGVGYAWLMILGLRTWWLAAITTPFLSLHVVPTTLLVGCAAGVLTSLLVVRWAVGILRRATVRSLLANQVAEQAGLVTPPARWSRWIAVIAGALALAAAAAGAFAGEAARALAFGGSGAFTLVALLALIVVLLRRRARQGSISTHRAPLAWLAYRNACRNPGRSALTIGLIAAATFLIVAISAFRLDAEGSGDRRASGTGGFSLLAESDQPVLHDLNTEDGQVELGFSSAERRAMADAKVFPFRVSGGDDASCLNLYQAQQPRVLGVPAELIARGGFAWAGSAAAVEAESANPWLLLDKAATAAADASAPVPVVLDEATALYALHLRGVGDTYKITDGHGLPVTLQVVGLLRGSVLQGVLLVSEANFLQYFPDASGYRYFLIDAPAGQTRLVAQNLDKALGDFGFATSLTTERLAEFFAVQNTYLSTFQSLGGLGLLLGTLGLAAVQIRSVVERRAELALLRAAGIRRALVARIVFWENLLLLVGGLAIGLLSAGIAILPHLLAGAAHFPWLSIAATLFLVLGVGLLAGLTAVRAAVRAPVLATLRGD